MGAVGGVHAVRDNQRAGVILIPRVLGRSEIPFAGTRRFIRWQIRCRISWHLIQRDLHVSHLCRQKSPLRFLPCLPLK